MHFFFKKAHVTEKTSSRQTTSRPYDKKNPDRAISKFFLTINEETEQFQDKILQLLVPNSKRLGGYTQVDELFSKSTHHSKIQRSATWFHSRKHSDDPCSYSTRGTRRGFHISTMKCSGAYRCRTHRIPHKEERRSSLTRILPM